jgi:hypothetical protein
VHVVSKNFDLGCVWLALCVVAASAVGCGGDDEGGGDVFVDAGDTGTDPQSPAGGSTGNPPAGTDGDTGTDPGDDSTGSNGSASTDDDATTAGDEDAGTAMDEEPAQPAEVTLPTDGNALSVCATDEDCNGDDLLCVAYGFYRGYCADDCGEDADCPAIDGIEATCRGGSCEIDCGVDGAPDGDCPANMECAQLSGGLLASTFVCQYPEPKDGAVYTMCDGLRGDSDCQEGLSCSVMVGLPLLSEAAAPYCSEGCTEDADCSDPGFGATPVCDRQSVLLAEGQCALDCDNDRQCPDDMLCIALDPLQKRCGYPLL